MVEPAGEDLLPGDAAVGVEREAHDRAPVPPAEVLTPERNEGRPAVSRERDPAGTRARLEVGRRWSDVRATLPGEALPREARPAARPAEVTALVDLDQRFGGLGAEIVAPVHGRVQPPRPRTEREPVRVSQPARDHAQVAAVWTHGEDGRAPRVLLPADVARRARPEIEPTVRADDDVVLLVAAVRQALQERATRTQGLADEVQAVETPTGRDEQSRTAPGQAERRVEPPCENARLRAPSAHDDDLAGLLGDVQAPVGTEGHCGRALQPGGVTLGGIARRIAKLGRCK